MSGGVDSAVAALLLQRQGYSVQAMFMKNWEEDDDTEYCTADSDFADAQHVCDRLGIELHSANFAAEYWDNVFQKFLNDYSAGLTPNPDVLCNREIKFKLFLDYARTLGADLIATGHYVRTSFIGGQIRLLKGKDITKDQSYFLNAVPISQLEPCLFPVGEMLKSTVREIAKNEKLKVHNKKDSTGVCFIGERPFQAFLAGYLPLSPGPIVDTSGVPLGEHRGLSYYTIGQRQGLRIGGQAKRSEAPWYVVSKRTSSNELVVSQNLTDLETRQLLTSQINWLGLVNLPLRCTAKTRYRQPDQKCWVHDDGAGGVRVDFDLAQRAVTPGQYVCFYSGDWCLGGGMILESPNPHTQS